MSIGIKNLTPDDAAGKQSIVVFFFSCLIIMDGIINLIVSVVNTPYKTMFTTPIIGAISIVVGIYGIITVCIRNKVLLIILLIACIGLFGYAIAVLVLGILAQDILGIVFGAMDTLFYLCMSWATFVIIKEIW